MWCRVSNLQWCGIRLSPHLELCGRDLSPSEFHPNPNRITNIQIYIRHIQTGDYQLQCTIAIKNANIMTVLYLLCIAECRWFCAQSNLIFGNFNPTQFQLIQVLLRQVQPDCSGRIGFEYHAHGHVGRLRKLFSVKSEIERNMYIIR